jgi:hypothetical protein
MAVMGQQITHAEEPWRLGGKGPKWENAGQPRRLAIEATIQLCDLTGPRPS